MANKIKIVVIIGPTASGKSDLGIKISKKISGEIISADSRQVYKKLDIGTGKVSRDKISNFKFLISKQIPISKYQILNSEYYSGGIRHHLIDVISPKKQFTADDFKRLGEKAIQDINNRGKIPIIVGGAGFYIDVLFERISVTKVPPNPAIRKKLEGLSVKKLYTKLNKLDRGRAKTIDKNNKRRLIRALEIVLTSGHPVPKLNAQYKIPDTKYSVLWIGLNPDKDKLAKKIKKRLDERINQGMIKEVESLRTKGVSWKRLDDLGLEYRWLSRWLKKQDSRPKGARLAQLRWVARFKSSDEYRNLLRDIIKYSKRQMTWFKRNREIDWITNRQNAIKLVCKFLKP